MLEPSFTDYKPTTNVCDIHGLYSGWGCFKCSSTDWHNLMIIRNQKEILKRLDAIEEKLSRPLL